MLPTACCPGTWKNSTCVSAAYPDVKPDVYPLAERSLLAHLQKLVREGRASERAGRFSAVAKAAG